MSQILPEVPKDGHVHTLGGYNGYPFWIQGEKYNESSNQTNNNNNHSVKQGQEIMVIIAGQSNSSGSSLEPLEQRHKIVNPRINQVSRGKQKTFNGKWVTNYNPGLPEV